MTVDEDIGMHDVLLVLSGSLSLDWPQLDQESFTVRGGDSEESGCSVGVGSTFKEGPGKEQAFLSSVVRVSVVDGWRIWRCPRVTQAGRRGRGSR